MSTLLHARSRTVRFMIPNRADGYCVNSLRAVVVVTLFPVMASFWPFLALFEYAMDTLAELK